MCHSPEAAKQLHVKVASEENEWFVVKCCSLGDTEDKNPAPLFNFF